MSQIACYPAALVTALRSLVVLVIGICGAIPVAVSAEEAKIVESAESVHRLDCTRGLGPDGQWGRFDLVRVDGIGGALSLDEAIKLADEAERRGVRYGLPGFDNRYRSSSYLVLFTSDAAEQGESALVVGVIYREDPAMKGKFPRPTHGVALSPGGEDGHPRIVLARAQGGVLILAIAEISVDNPVGRTPLTFDARDLDAWPKPTPLLTHVRVRMPPSREGGICGIKGADAMTVSDNQILLRVVRSDDECDTLLYRCDLMNKSWRRVALEEGERVKSSREASD